MEAVIAADSSHDSTVESVERIVNRIFCFWQNSKMKKFIDVRERRINTLSKRYRTCRKLIDNDLMVRKFETKRNVQKYVC